MRQKTALPCMLTRDHRLKTAAWILVVTFGLNVGMGGTVFAATDLIPGSGNSSQIPATHGVNGAGEWDEVEVDAAPDPLTGPGGGLTPGGLSSLPNLGLILANIQQGLLSGQTPAWNQLNSPLSGLGVIQPNSPVLTLNLAGGPPSVAISLMDPNVNLLTLSGSGVRQTIRFEAPIQSISVAPQSNWAAPSNNSLAYLLNMGPIYYPPSHSWSPSQNTDISIASADAGPGQTSFEVTITAQNSGGNGQSAGSNGKSGGKTMSSSSGPAQMIVSFIITMSSWGSANMAESMQQIRGLVSDLIRSLASALAEPVSAAKAASQASNSDPSKAATDPASLSMTASYKQMSLAARESMRAFQAILGAGPMMTINVSLAVTRFFASIVPGLDASRMFERFKTGLSQLDWMFMETARVHIRPEGRAAADGEASSDSTAARELVRAFRTLWADLSAMRSGAAAGPGAISIVSHASVEADVTTGDPAASEAPGSASVTGEALKRLLEDQGSLKFKRVTTDILIGDVLKVVKAAIDLGIAYRYDPAGVGMMVSGVFS